MFSIIISLSLVMSLYQVNVEAVIILPNFDNLAYVEKGSDLTIPWTLTDLESDIAARRWRFSNTSTLDFKILGFIIGNGSYQQSRENPFTNIEVTKPATLVIKNTNLDNNGTYRFKLERADGKNPPPSDVVVIVKEQPTAVINCSTTPTVNKSDHFVCLCEDKDSNISATATWSKDGVTLVSGLFKAILSLKNVNKNDTGSYTCRLASYDLSDQIIVDLTVNFGPTVQFPAEGKTAAVLNEQFTITCNVDGSPKPTYKVFHHCCELTVGVTRGKYTIKSVKDTDAGEYKCVAENSLGSVNKSFALTVTGNSNGYECSRGTSGSEWYIVFVTLIGGIVIGMVLMYGILFLRRRGNKNEGDDQRSASSRDDERPGEKYIPVYQELDAAQRAAGDNYQPLKIERNPGSNETRVENEAGYQELDEVRRNRDNNYQPLNPEYVDTS